MAQPVQRGRTSTREPAATSTYIYEIRLLDGNSVWAQAPDGGTVDAELEAAHTRLGTSFVRLGDAVVRSEEVRMVQLHEDDGSQSGLWDDLKQRLRGGSMTSYETDERTTQTRSRRPGEGRPMGDDGGFAERYVGYGQRPWSETKPFFLTSEFLTLLATIAAVAIGMAASDVFDSTRGFTLITALAAAYMISRGLAKSGTKDPNPDRGARY